jgi:hypothetical protein
MMINGAYDFFDEQNASVFEYDAKWGLRAHVARYYYIASESKKL